jgi:hypothetical protein
MEPATISLVQKLLKNALNGKKSRNLVGKADGVIVEYFE